MSLWSHVSQIFWEEGHRPEGGPASAPASRVTEAATGAPAFLRGAVRFVVVGASALVLTSQVTGIRLAAPVDADPSYCIVAEQQCKNACPKGAGNAACMQDCNMQREVCRQQNH